MKKKHTMQKYTSLFKYGIQNLLVMAVITPEKINSMTPFYLYTKRVYAE